MAIFSFKLNVASKKNKTSEPKFKSSVLVGEIIMENDTFKLKVEDSNYEFTNSSFDARGKDRLFRGNLVFFKKPEEPYPTFVEQADGTLKLEYCTMKAGHKAKAKTTASGKVELVKIIE
ncbi:MAG: hypothetical protein MJ209_00330 [archaeon]|nr:hypothetical protein [archaeon]